jgi:hypothetical protein
MQIILYLPLISDADREDLLSDTHNIISSSALMQIDNIISSSALMQISLLLPLLSDADLYLPLISYADKIHVYKHSSSRACKCLLALKDNEIYEYKHLKSICFTIYSFGTTL